MSSSPPAVHAHCGLRIRRAARVLLLDTQGRILLFRFVLADRPPFWITPGGECEAGEDFPAAARRELREETGILAEIGPQVARREADFTLYNGEDIHADERYFVVRVAETAIDTSGHTEVEQSAMGEHRWFAPHEITGWAEAIYPLDLAQMLAELPA